MFSQPECCARGTIISIGGVTTLQSGQKHLNVEELEDDKTTHRTSRLDYRLDCTDLESSVCNTLVQDEIIVVGNMNVRLL